MKKFVIFIIVALTGFLITFVGIYIGDKLHNGDTEPISTMQLPFNSFIAATGIVESGSKNIVIGSLVSGVIKDIFVKNGQEIKKGELLFTLDDSDLSHNIALLQTQKTLLLAKMQAAKDQFKLIQEFSHLSSAMVTSEKFKTKENAYKKAKAALRSLNEKIKILTEKKELYKIYAPLDGIVLSSKSTIGSYFDKGNSKDLLILGNNKYNLNVSINEYDIWKFEKNTPAIAFDRGHPELKTDIHYLYTVPFVRPKTSLTGSSTEKSDTRVLHVFYAVDKNISFPLYIGEQLDVFIKTDK